MKTRNEIVDISFEYSLNIIEFSEQLEAKKKHMIARQLLKSGTSIGANIRESQSAESRADFVHKLKISQKEAEETEYWLLTVPTCLQLSKTRTQTNGAAIVHSEIAVKNYLYNKKS